MSMPSPLIQNVTVLTSSKGSSWRTLNRRMEQTCNRVLVHLFRIVHERWRMALQLGL
jgi:hypothetical protein